MKRIVLLSLAVAAGAWCVQPVFAQDQEPDKKKESKDSHHDHGDKGTPQGTTKQAPKGTAQAGTPQFKSHGGHAPNNNNIGSPQVVKSRGQSFQGNNNGSAQNVQQTSRHEGWQNHNGSGGVTFSVQGNRENHYGGHWVDGNVHSDWGRDGEHEWHHHHYRWYDGGWLIIDTTPAYYPTGSIGASVQQKLAEQGYYNGPIDGDVGPGTRQAIADYQADHGLRETGHINDPLLDSLGLQ